MAKEDLKIKDELQLRLRDAELTQAYIEAKKDKLSDERRKAGAELREFRQFWRQIREHVNAVNAGEAAPESVQAGVQVGDK